MIVVLTNKRDCDITYGRMLVVLVGGGWTVTDPRTGKAVFSWPGALLVGQLA